MNRHIFSIGLTAIATITAVSVSSTASAANLSREASKLTNMTVGTSEYSAKYDEVFNLYQGQSEEYSLSFDDWYAMNSFVNNERAAYGSDGAKLQELTELNLADLTWEAGARDVEVFFINEGAGYWNKFGYSTAYGEFKSNDDGQTNDPLLGFWNDEVTTIWNGIASQNSILANGGSMSLGEGYRIGDVAAGDTVDFFLRNPHSNVFDSGTVDDTLNADGLQHVTTYQYGEFLVLAYEDLFNGGDKDYNDVVIAVRGLTDTAKVPEPGTVMALLGLGVAGVVVRKKDH